MIKGRGYGLLGDIIVGIIGAFIGGCLFGLLGLEAGGLIGAMALVLLLRLIKRA